jgi:integrase
MVTMWYHIKSGHKRGGEPEMGVFRKNTAWWIDYRADGRRIREKVGPSKALADKVLRKRQVEIAEGRFLNVRKVRRYLFAAAAERFLDYSEANKKSFKRDRCIVHKHLLPAFGKRFLNEITSWDVERYKAARKTGPKPATVNRELACLKTIFNKAIHWDMTDKNPVRGVKLFRENNRRDRYLTTDEIPVLIRESAPHLRPLVITALNTGMRLGEILALTWKDVNFDRGQITIRDSKNGESRVIEMNSALSGTLRTLERRPQYPQVFLGRSGRPVADFRGAFNRACKRAHITNFRFHDLRHTFASHLVMNGTDLATVKELLGHKTLQMTMRYAHLSQPHKKKAVEDLGDVFGGHYMDTGAKSMDKGVDTQNVQPLEKHGAGGGNRTHMGARPGGF